MANGHTTEQPGYRTSATAKYPSQESKPLSHAGGCSCHSGGADTTSACCDLTCFERPRYFCGHLLTDADLSLDQRYAIEKQKLYHRALHGTGIVCGLRLTCHPHCCGDIVIGEGFAIDDCGNDLVVCQPEPFDVIARLREKKLLIPAPLREDCLPGDPPEECLIPQCFYVVACYDEEGQEYATPLTPGCGPSLSDCEPTRIRETVRFDIVDKLPEQKSAFDDLQARIEHCFKLFTEGPFAQELKSDLVKEALEGEADPERHQEFCDALCRLRALFRFYLDVHPDRYNCRMKADVDSVKCPAGPEDDDEDFDGEKYAEAFAKAFCRIVDLAYAHVLSCVMGELAFPCAEPPHASCVVLGTVTVENDCVVRVCNCPRKYVWSFASFFQVLMATLFGGLACESDDPSYRAGGTFENGYNPRTPGTKTGATGHVGKHEEEEGVHCCVEFKPAGGCATFVEQVRQGGFSLPDLATGLLAVVRSATRATRYALDPTRSDVLLLNSLRGQKVPAATESLRSRDVRFNLVDAPENPVPGHPLDELSAYFHQTRNTPLVVTQRQGVIVDVREQALHDRVDTLEAELRELKAKLNGNGGEGGSTGPETTKRGPKAGRS